MATVKQLQRDARPFPFLMQVGPVGHRVPQGRIPGPRKEPGFEGRVVEGVRHPSHVGRTVEGSGSSREWPRI